jgi:dTDP-4-dehydrorhamnose 3,5-epimerase
MPSRQISGGQIDGVVFRHLSMHGDSRGRFTEVFSRDWGLRLDAAQWSVVESEQGVLRGMHVHVRHDEYYCLLRGRVFVGLRDIRPWARTHGVASLYELCGGELAFVQFPPGVVHGWYFAEDSSHLQAVSETYSRYRHDDNFGCHWTDPGLGIPWPQRSARVSDEANAFPGLEALCRTFLAAADRPDRDPGRGQAEAGAR